MKIYCWQSCLSYQYVNTRQLGIITTRIRRKNYCFSLYTKFLTNLLFIGLVQGTARASCSWVPPTNSQYTRWCGVPIPPGKRPTNPPAPGNKEILWDSIRRAVRRSWSFWIRSQWSSLALQFIIYLQIFKSIAFVEKRKLAGDS